MPMMLRKQNKIPNIMITTATIVPNPGKGTPSTSEFTVSPISAASEPRTRTRPKIGMTRSGVIDWERIGGQRTR